MPNENYTDVCQLALFKNDDKQQGSKKPDYTGPGEMKDGTKIRAAAWLKKDKNGNTYMSVNVQEQQQGGGQQSGGAAPDDPDIPFDHGAFEL